MMEVSGLTSMVFFNPSGVNSKTQEKIIHIGNPIIRIIIITFKKPGLASNAGKIIEKT
jgi:hypothetical protein